MEGVKILNEVGPMSEGIWIGIGMFVLIGIFTLIWGLTSVDLDRKGKIGMTLLSLVPFAVAITLFFTNYLSPMKYEVVVDDNVRLSEFEEEYEIVEKRGKIYVVEERENGN